ncbi:hypothetical protein ADJ73_05145 [Arsenicicoccus sp. oral taxon 190]|nr:hypothetical protein ADJ73_05145 [Arsenicicoccus sp. oral taxon 190]
MDKAHDTIVDDILPKVVEAIAGIAAGSTAARAASSEKGAELGKGALGFIASKEAGQKLIEQVEPKVSNKQLKKELKKAAKQNKKGGGGFLITLGLLATAAAVAAVVYKKTAPQDDPWATPLADPYTGPQSSTIGTGTSTSSTTTTMSSTTSTSAAPIVSDHEAGDPLSAVSTEPVILDSKDQEQYAATTPSDATAYDRTDDGAGQAIDKGADPGAGQHRDDKPRDQH